jgi:uncharacterized protein (DUF2147 family)
MRFLTLTIAALTCLAMLPSASARASHEGHNADPATGLWLTQNERSVIEIKPCEKSLCGYVYWIIDGGMQYDEHNPDPQKRAQALCGLPILWGFEREDTGEWNSGKIYKADDGDLYDANLEILEDGTLKVRGYMGLSFLGKTQIWNRVSADQYDVCTLSQ